MLTDVILASGFLLNYTAAQKQPQDGHNSDCDVDGEADLFLAERAEDDTQHAASQHSPLQPTEERHEAWNHERGTD